MQVGSAVPNVIFKRYWECAQPNVKISKLNELLQSNRDEPLIIEPLLKVTQLIDVNEDDNESYADVLDLLKAGIYKYDVASNSTILKTLCKSLSRLQDTYPKAKDVAGELIRSLQEKIKNFPVLEIDKISKYNILYSTQNLRLIFSE